MIESNRAIAADLLDNLNEPQRAAVTHVEGPLLILAGPGSGKTRVVTRRVAYLSRTAARADEILALTFTNKAAREMKERVAELRVSAGSTVCTFHALCAKLLRVYADRAGLDRNYSIIDRDDRRAILKEAIEACGQNTTNYSPASVEQVISNAKNDLLGPNEFLAGARDWREQIIGRFYAHYETLLTQRSSLDFDDLLMRVALLLERDEEVLADLQDRFRFVLIDEYQDTNDAQYRIARAIAARHRNVCATGDPDQSIYGWRGANIENILRFEQDFPGAAVVRLEQNYRSTQRILQAADALIAGNAQRKQKTLWTENGRGAPVRAIEFESADREALFVAREIIELTRSGTKPGDVAVFYRVNSLSRVLEEAFIQAGVAYQIARGVEFYNRREVKDALSYLRALVNPSDDTALLRIINTPPRGIGDTTIERLRAEAARRGQSMQSMLAAGTDLNALGRSAAKVREFAALLERLRPHLASPPAEAVKQVILQSGLRAMYRGEDDVDSAPSANLDELINAAAVFQLEQPDATVMDWLQHAALVSDVDAVEQSGGKVTLMTLHAAKGLEFPVVYMIGMEEGLLPFRRSDFADADIEEERRLAFVGITRARQRLTLTLARYRMIRGSTQRTLRSPFLDEIRGAGVEWQSVDADRERDRGVWVPPRSDRATVGAGARDVEGSSDERQETRPRFRSAQLPQPRQRDDLDLWNVGTFVRHPEHGLGRVMSIHRGGSRTHVEVLFRDSGSRLNWVLEFAELERVDGDEME